MNGEMVFNNTLTTVISHYCIFTKELTRLIHCSFWLLLSLPWSWFSPHCGEFTEIMINEDEVLPCAKDQRVSSGTVPQGGQDIVTFNLYLSLNRTYSPQPR